MVECAEQEPELASARTPGGFRVFPQWMFVRFRDKEPRVAPGAWVAANAVVRGEVTIGEGSVVLYGAVVTAEGGPVEIGSDCVVMENAVLRGTPRDPLVIGDRVLVGPHAHLTGCRVDSDSFIATGASIFNGARVEPESEVRIGGVVHVNSRLPAGSVVPIGWVAVGDPAKILPPDQHDEIWRTQHGLDFPRTVFAVDRRLVPAGERIRRFARSLQRHREDEILE